jgi:hypothetical protein
MSRTLLVCVLVLAGCGGASEGAGPKDASNPPESAAQTPAAAEPDKAAATRQEAAAPQASAELALVLQAVIDDPELEPYLHLDKPERFPLKISGQGLAPDIELTKGTKPVEVVTGPGSNKDPVLAFTKIDVSADKATVTYRYEVENLRGSCSLAKRDGAWQLLRSRLVQN